MTTRTQPRDGHRMERPVMTRTVPKPVVVSKCECGVKYDGRDRFELWRKHHHHRATIGLGVA